MTGYTHQWNCRICKEHQDTIDTPKYLVCYKCVENLAVTLCSNEMSMRLNTPGIDKDYWIDKAHNLVNVLFGRWKPEPLKLKPGDLANV